MTLSKETLSLLYAQGYNLYSNGKWKEAATYFQLLTTQEPAKKKHWKALAACRQMTGDDKGALTCYATAALLDPEDPHLHLHSAECFYQLGDLVNGRAALESAKTTLQFNDDQEASQKLAILKKLWNVQ